MIITLIKILRYLTHFYSTNANQLENYIKQIYVIFKLLKYAHKALNTVTS